MASAADIAAALTKQVEQASIMLVLEIAAELIKATPVDTGWARANWMASIGREVTETSTKPDAHGTADSALQQASIAEALRFKLGDGVLYVGNAVPYISALNYGHSAQAPAGFVDLAVDVALQAAQAKLSGKSIDISSLRADFQSSLGADAAANLAEAYAP